MSELKVVSNEQGLTCTITFNDGLDAEPFWGGDSSNPSWQDYVATFKEEYRPHIELLRKAIEENDLVGEKADHYANMTSFKFSDGQHWGFSWRAWGDLMQSIVNKNEGYMAYYM